MAFFNEFPHTRTYDSDLAWLIKRMKEVLAKMDRVDEILATIEELLAQLPETIRDEVRRQLLEMLADGSIVSILYDGLNKPIAEIEARESVDNTQKFSIYRHGVVSSLVIKSNGQATSNVLKINDQSIAPITKITIGGSEYTTNKKMMAYLRAVLNQRVFMAGSMYITGTVLENDVGDFASGCAGVIFNPDDTIKISAFYPNNNILSGGYYNFSGLMQVIDSLGFAVTDKITIDNLIANL